jgi:hypothetical protein
MAKGRIKTNRNGTVFFSRVVTDGKAQKQFGEKAEVVGACVATKTKGKSYNRSEQTKILKSCVREAGLKGNVFGGPKTGSYADRKAKGLVGGGQPVKTV